MRTIVFAEQMWSRYVIAMMHAGTGVFALPDEEYNLWISCGKTRREIVFSRRFELERQGSP